MTHDTVSSTASKYMQDLRKYPLLTSAEFDKLIRLAHKGDRDAINKIVQGNLRFVIRVASEYAYADLPFSDLIAEGNLGLIKAVEKFDPNLGYKFSTYAVWWIRNAIQRALRLHKQPLRLPFNRQDDLDKLLKSAEKLSQELGRQVSPEEVADHLDMNKRRAIAAFDLQNPTLSLDTPATDDFYEGHLHEQIAGAQVLPDEALEQNETALRLKKALRHLKKRDAHVIDIVFGFNNDSLTLAEAGRRLGISKERARQLRNRALGQLRNLLTENDLYPTPTIN